MDSAEFVIIGAGFAGAATAYHLVRAGAADVLLLDKEERPGVHSSGRNAALVRQVVPQHAVARLAHASARAIAEAARTEPGLFRRTGSLLLADTVASAAALLRQAAASEARSAPVDRAGCERRFPLLAGARIEGAVFTADDGVADAALLLEWFLTGARERGARVRWGCEVFGFAGGTLATSQGLIRAQRVVNAAGAWAGPLGSSLRGARLPLRPTRRHLFTTAALAPPLDPALPFVWDVGREVYFRPEAGGLLLSPCDEEDWPPSVPPTEPAAARALARKLDDFPRLSGLAFSAGRAGLRTLTPDGAFAIGPDPREPALFWVAGLGGHGVTTSFAVGRAAAAALLGAEEPSPDFAPARFGA